MLVLTLEERIFSFHMGYIAIGWGILAPMFGRLSFLVNLLFVSGIDPKVKKWTIYTFVALQLIVNIGAVIVFYAQCGTHDYIIWSDKIWAEYHRYCWEPIIQTNYGYFSGGR